MEVNTRRHDFEQAGLLASAAGGTLFQRWISPRSLAGATRIAASEIDPLDIEEVCHRAIA